MLNKKTHTRYFAANQKDQIGKSGNVPAGTIVDTNVVSKSMCDFYLTSAQGIKVIKLNLKHLTKFIEFFLKIYVRGHLDRAITCSFMMITTFRPILSKSWPGTYATVMPAAPDQVFFKSKFVLNR